MKFGYNGFIHSFSGINGKFQIITWRDENSTKP